MEPPHLEHRLHVAVEATLDLVRRLLGIEAELDLDAELLEALPEAHVRRVSELNGSALALTEHGNVMSHPKFEQAASAEGIKPIFGIELYCGDIDEERRRQMKNHLTILARNDEGYQTSV
jgi:DNA polymerase III alpha subunit (gram-positive type)